MQSSEREYAHCTAVAEGSKLEGEARAEIGESAARDREVESRAQGAMHRIRNQTGKTSCEARIAWTCFVPDAQRILMKGFGFRVLNDGKIVVAGRRRIPRSRYAYDAETLEKILTTAPGAR